MSLDVYLTKQAEVPDRDRKTAREWAEYIIANYEMHDGITLVTCIERIQRAAIAAMREEAGRLREALAEIAAIPLAYPKTIFPEPDWGRAHKVLTAAGMTLDAISAANMRVAAENGAAIAREALAAGGKGEGQ